MWFLLKLRMNKISKSVQGQLLLLAILAIGLALRIPLLFHSSVLNEELLLVKETMGLLSFATHFKYQTFSAYSLLLVFPVLGSLAYLASAGILSVYFIFETYGLSLAAYPTVIMGSRLFGLILFVLTLICLFETGKRLGHIWIGLLACLILAVNPLSLQASGFVLAQHGVLFLLSLLLFIWAGWVHSKNGFSFILICLIWGLLSAVHVYFIFLGPFLMFYFLSARPKLGILFALISILAYLAASFYIHLDIPLRLDSVAYQFGIRRTNDVSLLQSLFLTGKEIGFSLILFFLFGVASLLFRLKETRKILGFWVGYVALFFLLFTGFIIKRPEDLLLILPVVVLIAALFLFRVFHRNKIFGTTLMLLLIAENLGFAWFSEPLFFARLKPKRELFQIFSPGQWKGTRLLDERSYNMNLVQDRVEESYALNGNRVSLKLEPQKMGFLALENQLNEIILPVQHLGKRVEEVKLTLFNDKDEKMAEAIEKVLPSEEWKEVRFTFNVPLKTGKKYKLNLSQTSAPIEMWMLDKNKLLDQWPEYVKDPSIPFQIEPEKDLFYKIVYGSSAK